MFVFDADGSIEGIDVRARVTPKTVIIPPLIPQASLHSLEQANSELIDRLPQRSECEVAAYVTLFRLPRAACAPVRSSEDPH